jgi:hypothetical protein
VRTATVTDAGTLEGAIALFSLTGSRS